MTERKSNTAKIVESVVNEIKPQMQDFLAEMRKDILADVAERLSKVQVPQPQTQAAPDLSQLTGMLKDGNLDLGEIQKFIGSAPSANQVPAGDLSKLNPQQMEYMKHQQMMELITRVLPSIISNQQQTNPMMQELMSRIFLEKINSSIYMDKVMIGQMAKSIGVDMPQSTGLTTPVSDQLTKGGLGESK